MVCRSRAQDGGAKFVVDPNWPKALPRKWVNPQVSGVCVDAQDHVFIVDRNDMTDKEGEVAQQAPPYIEFDPDGKSARRALRVTRRSVVVGFRDVPRSYLLVVVYRMFRGKITPSSGEYGD
jgi:hypothetical protein